MRPTVAPLTARGRGSAGGTCQGRSKRVTSALGFRPVSGSIESTDDEGAIDPVLSRLLAVFGKKQVCHSQAAIRSPALRQLFHLLFGWWVVKAVRPLERAT
jgi:hypothetical protein